MDPHLLSSVLKYYKRPEIQNAIVDAAESREIGVKYGEKGYGKRPDTLNYPRDVLECVKNGATSFHCSEEIWKNPLSIKTGMSKSEADHLRKGWDLVLDIDCPEFEYARVAAIVLVDALRYHGVQSVSVKFSGNNGFHVGVPSQAFPQTILGTPMEQLFPDGPRRIAGYLAEFMRDTLRAEIEKKFTLDQIATRLSKPVEELAPKGKLDPYQIMKIDTVLISSRHLYRMPYSLHEKSGRASVVVRIEDLPTFQKAMADPDVVQPALRFMDPSTVNPGEAARLVVQAYDFSPQTSKEDQPSSLRKQENVIPEQAIPEELFPPCVKKMLEGMVDGKKRAMFVLTNFLKAVGWDHDRIEARLAEWNKVNPEPVREVILKGHLRHHKTTPKVMPPSCSNKAYYLDMQVCLPDNLCRMIRNPAQYTKRKAWAVQQHAPKPKKEKKPKEPKNPKNTTEAHPQQGDAPDKESPPVISQEPTRAHQHNEQK